uniref:Cadherin domain-containing protein n=1 Tax=Nothobranchius furzeri TaxID=105023 RepID=A0A8C6PCD5_NOTFU
MALTGWILLLLVSSVKANFSPTFNSQVHHVCEDTPVGELAFVINATDPENDPLTYSISGVSAAFFEVEVNTGRVTVKTPLDTEASFTLTLDATVSDGTTPVSATLIIILDDTNDNIPLFSQSNYDISVPENAPIGSNLFKVSATDLDGNPITYRITEVTPTQGSDLFEIGQFNGEVKLKGRLNYTSLSTFYRLKITATDEGILCYVKEPHSKNNSVFSFITVKDVADLDPIFINIPSDPRVEENSRVGLSVLEVTAIDQDTGVNDDMIYSIVDSTEDGLFEISRKEGVISVSSNIDREVTGDTVILTLKATESNPNIHGTYSSATTTVQITIIDVNDNPPQFYKCGDPCEKATDFTGEVLEHTLVSVSFNMTVIDPDKISHTELSLEGEDKNVFSVEPSSTTTQSIVQLRVRQPENLDYEKKHQMVFQLTATDKDKPNFRSTATVTINIKDDNDNSPTFLKDTYELEVAEHAAVGTELATITADDPDTMDQGNITYRLLPESIRTLFDVEEHTGKVYVKNDTLLDREVRSLYSATLQARDSDGKPGSTVLEITLTDINDQPPVFSQKYYREFVEEGKQLELSIEATDRDEPGTVNSEILFSIDPSTYSNNFTIDGNTGVLRNKGELDREALDPELNGEVKFNVTATDQGTPPLSSSVPVIIIVQDVNDNSPKFEDNSYSFSVKEGEKGALVGTVHAEDLDQTADFKRISFSIADGSFGSFTIRTFPDVRGYKGNISVDQDIELDYETPPNRFRLVVEAADLEQKTASVVVDVNVLDVNDERPQFKPTEPVSVKENTTISKPVGRFTAHDKDTDHFLVFHLESVTCRCNDSLTPCEWFTLDPNGDVRVNPAHTVDYEQCVQAVVEAQVVDEKTEKGQNNSVTPGQMLINIEDINDNTPQFIYSDAVFVVVSEGANKGTSIARVTASDLDSGVNKQIDFKVQTVRFVDKNNQISNMSVVFEAITSQQKDIFVGLIQTTKSLEINLKGKYLVTVTATDTGGLQSSTVLEIFTVDQEFKVKFGFVVSVQEVEERRDKITRVLMQATGASVDIVSISEMKTAKDETNSGFVTLTTKKDFTCS